MTFRHRLQTLLLAALLAMGLAPQPAFAQAGAKPQQPSVSVTQATTQQAYTLPADKLAKAVALSRIRNILSIVGDLWGIALLWLLLATRAAARLEGWTERLTSRRWLQGLLFFAAYFLITTVAGLPLALYGHHAERDYQISVQSWLSLFRDIGVELALTLILGTPLLLFFNWIVRRWPRRYWFGAWLATLPILVIVVFLAPYIALLFDKFEPLTEHHAELVTQLEKVVARTGTNIPPDRMYLMKASEKTNGLNAYVTGLGATKRIVVWDTTAGRIPNVEVMFIFGHETGHYVLHHIVKGLTVSAIGMFFLFWVCAGFARWLVSRYGESWDIHPEMGAKGEIAPLATRPGFVVLLFAVSLAGLIVQPASNTFSRYLEHQTDVYGQEAMHGLVPDPQRALDSASLRRARSTAKLGVEQLAARLSDRGWSVRPPLVISWESGATSSVPPALIAAIADELHVEVAKLTRRGGAHAESRLDRLRDTPRLQALLTRLARARSISEASAFALLEGSQSSFAFRGAPEDEQYLLILERFVDQFEKDN